MQIATANNLKNSELIILTVNDSRQSGITGNVASGTHWSLLALEPNANKAYYIDSLPHLPNLKVSKVLLGRIAKMLASSCPTLVELDAPRQRNSYDCGMLYILTTRMYWQSQTNCCFLDVIHLRV